MRDYIVLDVFTNVPLQGNQLAVFTDATGIDDALMQRVARELNLSETVFVFAGDGDCDARIRIFTPGAELPFAGHPVLGTAFVVAERLGLDQVRLGTGRGVVTVVLERRAQRSCSARWSSRSRRSRHSGKAISCSPRSARSARKHPPSFYDKVPGMSS